MRAVGASPLNVEQVLQLDPLVAISSAIAARAWVWPALAFAGGALALCVLFPRAFCGYLCPLGTTIDVFDWLIGNRFRSLHLRPRGWWMHGRFLVLATVIVAAGIGVQLAGHVAAIPVLTRGLECSASPVQIGLSKGWHLVPSMTPAKWAAAGLLAAILAAGLLGRRFWCRCLCPTGAVFSLASLLRLTDRKVTDACVKCGRCEKVCTFGAVREDYTTRAMACTFCQDCGGACPTGAIQFTGRWARLAEKPAQSPPGAEVSRGRRQILLAAFGGAAAGLGLTGIARGAGVRPVRPPGALDEAEFLARCVRCGNCMRACPTGILQPADLSGGLDGLWTPRADADFAGCDPDCTNCTQVCPTGAIRELTLADKRDVVMGLAVVNERTCLRHAGAGECRLCVEACDQAGYSAIKYVRIGAEFDAQGRPIEGSGMLAPSVRPGRCVGCGLCQARCHAINVRAKGLLTASAIVVLPDRQGRGQGRGRGRGGEAGGKGSGGGQGKGAGGGTGGKGAGGGGSGKNDGAGEKVGGGGQRQRRRGGLSER